MSAWGEQNRDYGLSIWCESLPRYNFAFSNPFSSFFSWKKFALSDCHNPSVRFFLLGSVMFMFEGYFGRILHTGDMRFNESLIVNNPILFPVEKRNKELMKCSIPIDECIFDNTYCDPIFKFPRRDKACELLVEIIEKNMNIPNVRFLICVDSLGKEELLVFLSEKF